MRNILFRGKRLDNGEWVYGSLVTFNGFHVIVDHHTPNGDEVRVIANTVGQYTGLKDRAVEMSWEGGVFKEDDSGIVRSVFRVPGGLAFEDNPVTFGYDHRAPVYPYSSIAEMQNASWLSQCCEIIGNIHDNPDLLK